MAFIVIMCICYLVVALIRTTPIQNEWLPLISGTLGGILSTLAFYAIPEIVSSTPLGLTVIYGFFSGLAATGSNQVFKQAFKYFANKYGIAIANNKNKNDQGEE